MEYLLKDIIDSLEMIQNICEKHGICDECPFLDEKTNECMLENLDDLVPCNWELHYTPTLRFKN